MRKGHVEKTIYGIVQGGVFVHNGTDHLQQIKLICLTYNIMRHYKSLVPLREGNYDLKIPSASDNALWTGKPAQRSCVTNCIYHHGRDNNVAMYANGKLCEVSLEGSLPPCKLRRFLCQSGHGKKQHLLSDIL